MRVNVKVITTISVAILLLTITILLINLTPNSSKISKNIDTPKTNNTAQSTPQQTSKDTVEPNAVTIHSLRDDNHVVNESTLNNLEVSLGQTLKGNSINAIPTDAVVRAGTFKQELIDDTSLIYKTTFIIDISSIKQSYNAQILYSPLPPQDSGLRDYTTLITCIDDPSLLIYGEFKNCKDRLTIEREGK